MQKTSITLPEIRLVGLTVRTRNKDELDWQNGKMFPCVQRYFHNSIADKIPNRKKPGTTFCVYTDYESDFTGNYTYLIGEEVTAFANNLAEDLQTHIIPAQTYAKFTNGPAAMPNVVKEPWYKIWVMNAGDFGGKRTYIADFEVYDERAADHNNVVLDIYVGIDFLDRS
jgi:predicted transcriptional regulator YdeE